MLGIDLKEHILRQLDEIETCADNAKTICSQVRSTLDAEDVRADELHDAIVRLGVVGNKIVTCLNNLGLVQRQLIGQ